MNLLRLAFYGALTFAVAQPALHAQKVQIGVQYKCPSGAGAAPLFMMAAPGGSVALMHVKCSLSGLTIGGAGATGNDMLSRGIVRADGSFHASGYEVGALSNQAKDTYLADWEEDGTAAGVTIQLTYTGGTGVAQGMTGKLKIVCGPPANGVETCQGTGYYELPRKPAAAR